MIKLVEGIVLKKEPLREADEMLTLYTRELGKIRAKIIGVKKQLSKLRPLTSLFSRSSFQIFFRGGVRQALREPGKVIGGEVLQSYSGIRKEWDKIIQSSIWCETVNELTRAFSPNLQEYQLLSSALEQLEESRFPETVRLRSTLILLKILGYSFRHHAQWRQLNEGDKNLFYKLARSNNRNLIDRHSPANKSWRGNPVIFRKDEIERLKTLIDSYLALYLEQPLKAEIFRQKMEMVG